VTVAVKQTQFRNVLLIHNWEGRFDQ